IHWIRTGRTVLPSRVDVTVKPVSPRPASAEETATTPASSTSARSRLRGVISCLLLEVRDGRDGAPVLLQECGNRLAEVLCSPGGVPGPRPAGGADRRPGAAAGRPEATGGAGATAAERERGRLA